VAKVVIGRSRGGAGHPAGTGALSVRTTASVDRQTAGVRLISGGGCGTSSAAALPLSHATIGSRIHQ